MEPAHGADWWLIPREIFTELPTQAARTARESFTNWTVAAARLSCTAFLQIRMTDVLHMRDCSETKQEISMVLPHRAELLAGEPSSSWIAAERKPSFTVSTR